MPQQAPSKTELLELRAERELVREGKAVLEERRDLLAQLMLSQIKTLTHLSEARERGFDRARGLVQRAATRHGLLGLQTLASAGVDLPDPQWRVDNRLGIPWLASAGVDAPVVGAARGGPSASLEVAMAVSALRKLLANLLQVAEVESNLARLTEAFRRTQRRVNALDRIMLPELNTEVRAMEAIIDEMGRDDLVRALLIKRAQAGD